MSIYLVPILDYYYTTKKSDSTMFPTEKVSPQKAANLGILYVMAPTYILFAGVMLYFFTDGFTALHLVIEEKKGVPMMIIASLSAWLWWAFFVVKWKCWVIEHVDNLTVLESILGKKRMSYGLMNRIGMFEIASGATRDWYEKRYHEVKNRKVEPPNTAFSIPGETIIKPDTQKIIRKLLPAILPFAAIELIALLLFFRAKNSEYGVMLGMVGLIFLIDIIRLLVDWYKSLEPGSFIVKLNERYIQFQNEKPIMWKNVAFIEFVEPYFYLKIAEDFDDDEFSYEAADYYDYELTHEAQFPDKDPETINRQLASYWTKGRQHAE